MTGSKRDTGRRQQELPVHNERTSEMKSIVLNQVWNIHDEHVLKVIYQFIKNYTGLS